VSDAFDLTLVPEGLRAADFEGLAAEFGTPLFVYDEDEIRRRCREYVSHFGAGNVAYAAKAFLCTAMARVIAEEGLHLDAASGGELYVGQRGGMPSERIVLHGNNKSEPELEAALRAGLGRVVVDSFNEIDRLERVADSMSRVQSVLVRITPGIAAHTHEFIETGTEDSKFGFTTTDDVALDAVARVTESPVLEFRGLHCHIGSQIERLDAYDRTVAVIARFADEVAARTGIQIAELDLGGGLAARYLPSDPVISVEEYAATARRALDEWWPDDLQQPRLIVEPGRSIVASSAITLYRVGTVKEIPGVGTYVAVDGGMSDNPRPVLYGAGYEAYLPSRPTAARPLRCRVVGKHCEQGDVVVADAQLPDDVAVGDLLATPATGAYGYAMASNYNKVPRPAVVFVHDGTARLVVRRETDDDLTRLDVDEP
jgi:diaminopimelate decarboxylase